MEATTRLVLQAQAGDAAAFGELIARHERSLLALAYARTGNAAVAADVVQEASLRAWRRVAELKDTARFTAWIAQIVRRSAVDAVRRGPPPTAPLDDNAATAVARADADPSLGQARADTRAAIDGALATLDEVTRAAVVLRYFDDLPSRAIGELLNLSPAAVDMRLSRARAQLRQALAAHAEPAEEPRTP